MKANGHTFTICLGGSMLFLNNHNCLNKNVSQLNFANNNMHPDMSTKSYFIYYENYSMHLEIEDYPSYSRIFHSNNNSKIPIRLIYFKI